MMHTFLRRDLKEKIALHPTIIAAETPFNPSAGDLARGRVGGSQFAAVVPAGSVGRTIRAARARPGGTPLAGRGSGGDVCWATGRRGGFCDGVGGRHALPIVRLKAELSEGKTKNLKVFPFRGIRRPCAPLPRPQKMERDGANGRRRRLLVERQATTAERFRRRWARSYAIHGQMRGRRQGFPKRFLSARLRTAPRSLGRESASADPRRRKISKHVPENPCQARLARSAG